MKKKLTLSKLVLGSLTEAQQRDVLGGLVDGSSVLINTVCANPPPTPPPPSLNSPCTTQGPPTCSPPPSDKTMTKPNPCA